MSIFGSDGTDPEDASGLLQPADTLEDQGGVTDVLDTGWSPPERPLVGDREEGDASERGRSAAHAARGSARGVHGCDGLPDGGTVCWSWPRAAAEVSAVEGAPVTVAVANSRIEAELIVGFLRNHGLRAAVVTDDAGGQEPQFQLQGGVRVLVAASDEASARELLATTEDIDRAAP